MFVFGFFFPLNWLHKTIKKVNQSDSSKYNTSRKYHFRIRIRLPLWERRRCLNTARMQNISPSNFMPLMYGGVNFNIFQVNTSGHKIFGHGRSLVRIISFKHVSF